MDISLKILIYIIVNTCQIKLLKVDAASKPQVMKVCSL